MRPFYPTPGQFRRPALSLHHSVLLVWIAMRPYANGLLVSSLWRADRLPGEKSVILPGSGENQELAVRRVLLQDERRHHQAAMGPIYSAYLVQSLQRDRQQHHPQIRLLSFLCRIMLTHRRFCVGGACRVPPMCCQPPGEMSRPVVLMT